MDKKEEEFKIEKNIPIGQEEEDFESAFNQIFSIKDIMKELQEEYHEMETKIYYLKKNENYIQKDGSPDIFQKINCIKEKKEKISSKEDIIDIDEEKNEKDIISQSINSKNTEIFINKTITESIKKNEENYLSGDTDKQNKFRVYSINDFNIFHPGGTVEFFKKIKEELNEEINQNVEGSKSSKFKILKEKKKKVRKKVKEKKKRKEKPDDIRKKIKTRFLKAIKNRMNQMLKISKSKEFFDFLPQCFICNISKQKNKSIINMKFKELMSYKFYEEENKTDNNNKTMLQKKRSPDQKKYDNNVKVLKYLEKNYDICKKSNFNVIGNMTFREIFNEYLKSDEFEKEVEKLKTEQNNDKYIKDYMIKAYSFINYFSSCT